MEAYLRRMSQMYVRGLEHIGIYNIKSFSCAILKLVLGNWLWILDVDFRRSENPCVPTEAIQKIIKKKKN